MYIFEKGDQQNGVLEGNPDPVPQEPAFLLLALFPSRPRQQCVLSLRQVVLASKNIPEKKKIYILGIQRRSFAAAHARHYYSGD